MVSLLNRLTTEFVLRLKWKLESLNHVWCGIGMTKLV